MDLISTYLPMFLMMVAAVGLGGAFWIGATLLGRALKDPTYAKNQPYECGSESTGGRHVRISVKFYLTAILFVVFDIETVFVYPWAVHFRSLGWVGFAQMLSFLATIAIALVYVWRKGALEWEN